MIDSVKSNDWGCSLRPMRDRRSGFTIVEMLVVLFLVLLLAAIGLPTVKSLLSDQKASKSARNIAAFFDAARSRAIAEDRYVGIRLERRGTDLFGLTVCDTLRELTGVPAYSGDTSDAVATLQTTGTLVNSAEFSTNDSPQLWLSAQLLNNTDSGGAPNTADDYQAPIQVGDLLELPGGRTVPILTIPPPTGATTVTVTFDLTEGGRFPSAGRALVNAAGDQVKFKIHRRPVPSTTKLLTLPRGMAIDLVYSGIGVSGTDFGPLTTGGSSSAVDIIFGPDGSVSWAAYNGLGGPPVGQVFLCLGRTDGLAEFNGTTVPYYTDLFQDDSRITTNIRDLSSLWLVINPATGRVTTSPFASLPGTLLPIDRTDPAAAGFSAAISQTRSLAQASATLDSSP